MRKKTTKSPENNLPLLKLISLIVNEDDGEASKIIKASPSIVHQSLLVGATRHSELDYYYRDIGHYLVTGDTALHATAAGHRYIVVKLLTGNGADVRARDRRGAEPLHYASDRGPVWNWNPKAQVETISVLLEAGAKTECGQQGWSYTIA